MEQFAFLQAAADCEQLPAHEVNLPTFKLPSTIWMGFVGTVAVVAAIGATSGHAMAYGSYGAGGPDYYIPGIGEVSEAEYNAYYYGTDASGHGPDYYIPGIGEVSEEYYNHYYYGETSYHDEYDDCYDDGHYYPVSYHDGGYVDTYYNVGLNVRSGPSLDYRVIDGIPEGDYAYINRGVVYEDGYAWVPYSEGGWIASDYLD